MTVYEEKINIATAREYKVVKSNEIIQKARYELSVLEQKTIAYIVSMIKPGDTHLKEYEFDIRHYSKVCGIDYDSGKNYENIKSAIKGLRDKSFWIKLEDGSESLCSWVNKANVNKRSGKVKIRLDDDMQKYLIGLLEQFTQYELLSTLPMKSQYSFRIYELLKSYAFTKTHIFNIDELRSQLMAENYERFPDFRRNVLDIAMKEINEYTDIEVSYDLVKKGNKVIQVIFRIKERESIEKWIASNRAIEALKGLKGTIPGQINIYDFVN